MAIKHTLFGAYDRKRFLLPFILVTSLFFLWGFAHGLLDVLNKHFQEILNVSKAESGLVQFSVYGGYFLAALPAGFFMNRFGYKKGIILGLLLYALGAALFYPAAILQSFTPFLFALLIIAFGLAFLETAANPYVAVLGPAESAERRLNLSQSFNGLGWIFGPLIGGVIIFGLKERGETAFSSIAWPYVGVAIVVFLVAMVFIRTPLPEINDEASGHDDDGATGPIGATGHDDDGATGSIGAAGSVAPTGPYYTQNVGRKLWSYRHFRLAVVAQFFYVAAQTGINSFFINYTTETIPGITNAEAAIILSFGGMGLFWAGRLSGSLLMRTHAPHRLLSLYAGLCILLMLLVLAGMGWVSVTALFITYFFMSIMFPTIFVLGLKGLGPLTKKGSSYLVMAIVGGAFCPMLMGFIADHSAMQWGYLVPLACFAFILYFGSRGYRVV